MRFGLKCIITLAILYRAIVVSQGGAGTAALTAKLADAVPLAQARMREEIATRVDGWCRGNPATCLENAARLTRLVSGGDDRAAAPATSRRQGAVAAPTR